MILSRTLKGSSAQRSAGTFKGSRKNPLEMVLGGTLPEEPYKVLAKSLLWFFGNRRSNAKTVAILSGIEPAPSVLQSVTLTTRLCWELAREVQKPNIDSWVFHSEEPLLVLGERVKNHLRFFMGEEMKNL